MARKPTVKHLQIHHQCKGCGWGCVEPEEVQTTHKDMKAIGAKYHKNGKWYSLFIEIDCEGEGHNQE